VSRRFVKSADESPDVIKMAPRTEKGTETAKVWRGRFLRDNPSWCRLRQFRPTDNLLVAVIRQKEFSMPSYAGFGVINGDFVNPLRHGRGEPVRRSIEGVTA
jgi:hypothetical protein